MVHAYIGADVAEAPRYTMDETGGARRDEVDDDARVPPPPPSGADVAEAPRSTVDEVDDVSVDQDDAGIDEEGEDDDVPTRIGGVGFLLFVTSAAGMADSGEESSPTTRDKPPGTDDEEAPRSSTEEEEDDDDIGMDSVEDDDLYPRTPSKSILMAVVDVGSAASGVPASSLAVAKLKRQRHNDAVSSRPTKRHRHGTGDEEAATAAASCAICLEDF